MTREEFIKGYCSVPDLFGGTKRIPTDYGCLVGNSHRFAVPCNCEEESCAGWAMITPGTAEGHLQLYVMRLEK